MNKPLRPTKAAARRPKVTIPEDTLGRLEALAEGAFQRTPDLAERLLEELGRARIVPARKLPANVVTIGRAVTYRDELSGEEKTVTPVYPEEADISRGRISVLTPIGVALIGLAEGATLPWQTRSGETRNLTVVKVAGSPADGAGA